MRRALGQAEPRFQLHQVFTERKILLVTLASGSLGPETAQLFGALLLADLWQQALTRSRISAEKRHPVMLYVDEFQSKSAGSPRRYPMSSPWLADSG